MTDVMIDLETLGTGPFSSILTIGAIRFKRGGFIDPNKTYKSLPEKDVFYRRIKPKSCKHFGLEEDQETIRWWDKQDAESKFEALNNPDRISIDQALREFSDWFNSGDKIWGNGSCFDVTILSSAYRLCNINIPWKFWDIRDLRTMMDMGNVRLRDLPNNNKHHALHDCYRQIIGFNLAFEYLFKKMV